MKKRIFLLVLLMLVLTGCGRQTGTKKYTVIATAFPAYDWVREIVGSNNDVELLLLSDKGVDLHSYQATAQDMLKIYQCDLFLYVGGESDEWVEEVLEAVPNENRMDFSMMDALEGMLHEEEEVEGMQVRISEEEEAYDEHIWLSLRNAQVLCRKIGNALVEMAPEYAEAFRENADRYLVELHALDAQFSSLPRSRDTLLFCDRFPFRYLVEDYNLNYYAAFSGCSGDSEASFATVLFLADKAESLEIPVLLQLEDSDGQIAQTVAGCVPGRNFQILTLQSMQSVSLAQAQNSTTYLGLMEENLQVLQCALG